MSQKQSMEIGVTWALTSFHVSSIWRKKTLENIPPAWNPGFLKQKRFSILSFCCCLSTFTTPFQATGTNICSQFVIMFVVTYNLVPRPIWWKCVSRYFRRNGKDSFSETGLAQIVLSTEENLNYFPASILVGSLHLHFVFVDVMSSFDLSFVFWWPRDQLNNDNCFYSTSVSCPVSRKSVLHRYR